MIFTFLHSLIFKNDTVDALVYFLAVTLPYILFIGAFVFLLVQKNGNFMARIRKCVHVVFAAIIAYGFATIIKHALNIPRPFLGLPNVQPLFVESGASFPSGHATVFAALATAVYFHNKKAGTILWIGAILISLARVTAGIHYPIDILGGFVLGSLVAYGSNRTWRSLSRATKPSVS